MKSITAVILGGGQGRRLFPLTRERAKPAVSFAGKYRLIDIPISNCINSGIKRIFVLTQFLSASLHRHIMQTYQFDTFSDGFIDILAAEQTPGGERWFQGTADAVRATLRHTTYYKFKYMIILSGDHLYRMDYRKLLAYHEEKKADITVCTTIVSMDDAQEFGLLKADDDGVVQEFVEKPKDENLIKSFAAPEKFFKAAGIASQENKCLASMGIYVFNPETLTQMIEKTDFQDFGQEVIPEAIKNLRVVAFPFSDYWRDIGTIKSYYEANISLAQPETPFALYKPGWPFYTRTRSLPPSRITKSEIRDCIVVEGSQIHGARISDSIIGTRSVIREGSMLEEVVMSGADFYEGEALIRPQKVILKGAPAIGIGKNCTIKRAIIDKNVRIGDGAKIVTSKNAPNKNNELYYIRDGITIIPRGTIIPPCAEIIN